MSIALLIVLLARTHPRAVVSNDSRRPARVTAIMLKRKKEFCFHKSDDAVLANDRKGKLSCMCHRLHMNAVCLDGSLLYSARTRNSTY